MAATSSSNAWAVGRCVPPGANSLARTLILHWDGTTWERQSSPNVNVSTSGNILYGVAATSASNAWAVGEFTSRSEVEDRTLVLHWDGMAWIRQSSPNVGQGNNVLKGVAATSSSNAWAVGWWINGTLILKWNGTAWERQSSPQAGTGFYPYLSGVAATSSSNAWAVGAYSGANSRARTLILHWDGTAWERQSSPNMGTGDSFLNGVAATSASNAWAVGTYNDGTDRRALILHWDGKAWNRQSSPPSGDAGLNAVAATSSSNAWAVGTQGEGDEGTLILCWNGTAWKRQPSPDSGTGHNILNGVAANSSSNAWAVGIYGDGSAARTLVPHC